MYFYIFVHIDLQSEISRSSYLTNGKIVVDLDMEESSPISQQFTCQDNIKSFYLEGNLLNNEKSFVIGMGVKTEKKTAIYIWRDGVILSDNELFNCKEPFQLCQPGDVIGCRVWLESEKKGNQTFHQIKFSRNGNVLDYPVILEGNTPKSVVFFCDARCEDTMVNEIVDLNFGGRAFTHNIGNYIYLCK